MKFIEVEKGKWRLSIPVPKVDVVWMRNDGNGDWTVGVSIAGEDWEVFKGPEVKAIGRRDEIRKALEE